MTETAAHEQSPNAMFDRKCRGPIHPSDQTQIHWRVGEGKTDEDPAQGEEAMYFPKYYRQKACKLLLP